MTPTDIMDHIHKLDEEGMNALCREMARDYDREMQKAVDDRRAAHDYSAEAMCFEMSSHVANLSNYMLRVRRKIESMDAQIKALQKGEVAHHAV